MARDGSAAAFPAAAVPRQNEPVQVRFFVFDGNCPRFLRPSAAREDGKAPFPPKAFQTEIALKTENVHDAPPGDGDARLVPRVTVPRHPPE